MADDEKIYCMLADFSCKTKKFYEDPWVFIYDNEHVGVAKNGIRVHLYSGRCDHYGLKKYKGGLPFDDNGFKEFLNNILDEEIYVPHHGSKTPSRQLIAEQILHYSHIYGKNEILFEEILEKLSVDYTKKCYWDSHITRKYHE